MKQMEQEGIGGGKWTVDWMKQSVLRHCMPETHEYLCNSTMTKLKKMYAE